MTKQQQIEVLLQYHSPYDWVAMSDFFEKRRLLLNEIVTKEFFAKCITLGSESIRFIATHDEQASGFRVIFYLKNTALLDAAIEMVRKILDLDTNPVVVMQALRDAGLPENYIQPGLRIPGIVDKFEAACRAVLGQQVSVKAAIGQVNLLHRMLAKPELSDADSQKSDVDKQSLNVEELIPFLSAEQVCNADVSFLRMPQARKQSLISLATLLNEKPQATDDEWLALKGIGPWTVNYVKLRNSHLPDIFLRTDLIIKQQLSKLKETKIRFDEEKAAPYRTYLTLSLWNNS